MLFENELSLKKFRFGVFLRNNITSGHFKLNIVL